MGRGNVSGVLGVVVFGLVLSVLPPGSTDWKEPLTQAAAGADRLVVDLNVTEEGLPQPVFEIQGQDKVRAFLDAIQIDASESTGSCGCYGDVLFRLCRGEQLLVAMSFHHGQSLRWRRGQWRADAQLTDKSQEALPLWFEKQGFPALQKMREADLARKENERRENELFASFFPEELKDALVYVPAMSFEEDEVYNPRMGRKIAEAMPDKQQLAMAVCRALGVSSDGWGGTGPKERRILTALGTVADQDFVAALQELKGDRTGLLGVAKLVFHFGYLSKIPEGQRDDWLARLTEVAITDGPVEPWCEVIFFLNDARGDKVREFLRDVVRGKVGKEGHEDNPYFQEPGVRATAAMVLGLQGDESIRSEVKRLLEAATWPPDVAAFEIYFVALGDPTYIKREHFEVDCLATGVAAARAIERFKGAYGLDLLLEAPDIHPFGSWSEPGGEAIEAFERITGWHYQQPAWARYGRKDHISAARAWWQANGEEFVKKRRAAWEAGQQGQSAPGGAQP